MSLIEIDMKNTYCVISFTWNSKAKQTWGENYQNGGCLVGEGDGQEDNMGKDMREFSGEIEMFYIVIKIWVTAVYQVQGVDIR